MATIDDIWNFGKNTVESAVKSAWDRPAIDPATAGAPADAVAEAVGPSEVAPAQPAAVPGTGGGAGAPAGQMDPKSVAFFKAYHVPDAGIELIAQMDPEDQNYLAQDMMISNPTPKAVENPVDRQKLAAVAGRHSPDLADLILAAPENALSGITTSLASKLGGDGTGGKGLDREEIIAEHPELKGRIAGMTDADISKIVSGAFTDEQEAAQQGGVKYEDVKGKTVKIVQDAAFLRAGHKSGDVICVRIP